MELRKKHKVFNLSVGFILSISVCGLQHFRNGTKKDLQKRSRFLSKQSTSRSLLFTHSLDIIKKKANNWTWNRAVFSDIFRKINKETEKIVRYNHKTPHNNYLYVWIELGILGLMIFIYFLFSD